MPRKPADGSQLGGLVKHKDAKGHEEEQARSPSLAQGGGFAYRNLPSRCLQVRQRLAYGKARRRLFSIGLPHESQIP